MGTFNVHMFNYCTNLQTLGSSSSHSGVNAYIEDVHPLSIGFVHKRPTERLCSHDPDPHPPSSQITNSERKRRKVDSNDRDWNKARNRKAHLETDVQKIVLC